MTPDLFRRLLWSMAIGYGARHQAAILRWCCHELFWSGWPEVNDMSYHDQCELAHRLQAGIQAGVRVVRGGH